MDEPGVQQESAPSPETPEKKKLSLRHKLLFSGVGVIIVAVVATGIGLAVSANKTTTGTHETKPGSSNGQGAVISSDERDFINAYKDRYVDPEAVFNSEAAYLKANPGKDLTIGTDYFTGYNFDATPNAATSPLGFDILKLQPGAEITTQTLVDQFNQAVPEMNRLANLLAKNPLPDQVKVIEDEFNEYTGFNNPDSQQLVDKLAAVVKKYGSNAVYVINNGTTDTAADKTKASIFGGKKPIIDNVDASGATDAFNIPASISITVTSYDKNNKSVVATEILDNFQFGVARAENFDPANGGLIGIGAK